MVHVPRVRSERELQQLERIGRERLVASRQVERALRRELARCCLEMIGAAAAGMALVGLALRVDDAATGRVLLLSGMFVIVAGVTLSLYLAHRRAEERGDL